MRKRSMFLPALILVAVVAVAYAQNYSVSRLKIVDANDALVGHVVGFLGDSAQNPLIAVKATPSDIVLMELLWQGQDELNLNRESLVYYEFAGCSGDPYMVTDAVYKDGVYTNTTDYYDRKAGFSKPGKTLYLPDKYTTPNPDYKLMGSYWNVTKGECKVFGYEQRNLVPAIKTGMDFSIYEPPYRLEADDGEGDEDDDDDDDDERG